MIGTRPTIVIPEAELEIVTYLTIETKDNDRDFSLSENRYFNTIIID